MLFLCFIHVLWFLTNQSAHSVLFIYAMKYCKYHCRCTGNIKLSELWLKPPFIKSDRIQLVTLAYTWTVDVQNDSLSAVHITVSYHMQYLFTHTLFISMINGHLCITRICIYIKLVLPFLHVYTFPSSLPSWPISVFSHVLMPEAVHERKSLITKLTVKGKQLT